MSRFDTLRRLLREPDREVLSAQISRYLIPAPIYRRNRITFVRCRAVKPLPRPLPEIVIRWGTPDDEPLLQALHPRVEGYGHHFQKGRLLIIGTVSGELVSCNWIERDGLHVSRPNGYRFRYGTDAAWIFGAEIAPRFRLAGVFPKHFFELRRLVGEIGVTRLYGAIQADNPRSIASHLRLGFERLWDFDMTRVFGIARHVAIAAVAGARVERGYGTWDGRDPEPDPVPARDVVH